MSLVLPFSVVLAHQWGMPPVLGRFLWHSALETPCFCPEVGLLEPTTESVRIRNVQ